MTVAAPRIDLVGPASVFGPRTPSAAAVALALAFAAPGLAVTDVLARTTTRHG